MSALRRALPGVLMMATLVACSDSTAPKAPENLPLASGDVAQMAERVDSVFDQPILAMLRGGSAPLAGARASIMLASTAPKPGSQLRAAMTAERASVARLVMPGEPVVPSLLRGVTFVWNGDRYVVDTLANGTPKPGAPTNGVRFMLYPISESTGMPTGAALGYLEVVDNSSSTVARWTSRVVTNAALTVLQATNTVSGGELAGFAVSHTGFVTDGTRRIDQSFVVGTTEIRASWNAPFAGVSMEFRVTQTGAESAAMSWTLTTPQGSVRVVLNFASDGSGSAQIRINGALWAQQSWTSTGEVSDTAWQKADGSGPITEADAATLIDMLGFMDAMASLDDFETTIGELLGGAAAS
jgi:hypothetical protein